MELEDQFGIKISDEDAQKITTVGQAVDYVSRTSSTRRRGGARARAPDRRPSPRAARPRLHPHVVGARPRVVLRAARVPRRLRARARDRAGALRPLPGRRRGPAGQDPRARRLAAELRRRRARSSISAAICSSRRRTCPSRELERISRSRNVLAALLEAAIAARLPRARLRAGRGGGRGGLRRPDRVRAHRPRRQQDRAAGGARAIREPGAVRRARRRRPAARPALRVRRDDRGRAGRDRARVDEEGRGAGGRRQALDAMGVGRRSQSAALGESRPEPLGALRARGVLESRHALPRPSAPASLGARPPRRLADSRPAARVDSRPSRASALHHACAASSRSSTRSS